MKKSSLFMISVLMLVGILAEAREREGAFRRGRPQRFGNERSERVTNLRVGGTSYNGNGCPQGTMRVSFSPDNLSFSILFDQFVAEVGAGSTPGPVPRRRPQMKIGNITCNTIIPIEIPQGMQMEITRIDYRGFSALPDKSTASLSSVVNFRGAGGDGDRLTLRYQFKGPLMENYEISTDQANNGNSELSPCGGSTQLRITNQLSITARSNSEPASITLDSIDGSSNAIYYVNWRACQNAGGGGRPPRIQEPTPPSRPHPPVIPPRRVR